MAYSTMMVNYGLEGTPDARLRSAKSLADRFNATLIGVACRDSVPIVVEGIAVPAQLSAAEYTQLQELLADQQSKFVKFTQNCQMPTKWRSGVEPPTVFLTRECRAADILLVEQHGSTGNLYESLDPAGLILSAGRPVLTIPSRLTDLGAKAVVVGWKNTREARRVVQDSLPFLHEADRVFLVGIREDCADDDDFRGGIDDVGHYLAQHRIKAQPRLITAPSSNPAKELIRVAETEGADLIVAGAYGRSRVGEWIFGGVTRDLLRTSPFCCLFSH